MKVLFILLTILKIIGIIIAAILGLILLLLAVVLFVPIRYSGCAGYKKKPDVSVKISYLLHILSVKYDLHEGDSRLVIKILGFTLGKKNKKKKRKTTKNKDKKNKKQREITENNENQQMTEENIQVNTKETEIQSNVKSEKYVTEEEDTFYEEKEKKSKKGIFKNIKDKYNNISAKVKNIGNEIKDESNKRALRVLLGSAGKVLKHIKPKYHEIVMLFGTGDPASTGEILGAAYAMAFLTGVNLSVTPDFENKVFELESSFKGRIRLFTLLIIAFKTYRNEDFKKALHRFI